ncbi:aldo/keto reductase [Sorangium sp. So ce429]
MEKRRIGSLEVSVVGIGCNNFGGRIDEQRTAAVVDAALDAGINFFDTADIYGGTRSEELLGRALGGRRSQVIIATKFGLPLDDERKGGAKPAYIQRAVEDSLRRLGTDPSGRCWPRASASGSPSCRISRSRAGCSPGSTSPTAPPPRAPGSRRPTTG